MTKVGEGLGRARGRAALIARADKRAPLVIQLARYCPMILDRPPIHRFNAALARAPSCASPFAFPPSVPPRPRAAVPPRWLDEGRDGLR